MKALRWHAKKDVRIEDIPVPEMTSKDVKVEIKWCGICGSDLHEYLEGPLAINTVEPHPLTGFTYPVTLGHELSGQVVEVGADCKKLKVGDKVTVEPVVVCGECPACLEGKYNMCEKIGWFGNCGIGGGFAEYTVFPEAFVHKLPDSVSYEFGALTEPLTVGIHAVRESGLKVGQTAIVSGAGPIGLSIIKALKAAGAAKVFVLELEGIRHQYALDMGADIVIDPTKEDAVAKIQSMTDGLGAHVAFETAGVASALNTDVQAIRYEGSVIVLSLWTKDAPINPNDLVYKQKKIRGSVVYAYEFPSTIELMAEGKITEKGMITKKIHIDDIVDEGFEVLSGPEKQQHVKILVTPDKSLL